jgi:hypothetical protein
MVTDASADIADSCLDIELVLILTEFSLIDIRQLMHAIGRTVRLRERAKHFCEGCEYLSIVSNAFLDVSDASIEIFPTGVIEFH